MIFLSYDIKNYYLSFIISFIFDILRRIMTFFDLHSIVFVVEHVTSFLKFRVLGPLVQI